MRGIFVLLDVGKINDYFGFNNVKDEHSTFAKEITEEGLNRVLRDLCVKGTIWERSKIDRYMIERTTLKLKCRIRVSFLKLRLMPKVHSTTVGEERL